MIQNCNRKIMHLDVNSAYVSFSAIYMLQQGETLDIREIPSIVGGDPKSRHGIVLAKSDVCQEGCRIEFYIRYSCNIFQNFQSI